MTSYCSNCIHHNVCGNEGVDDVAMTFCADKQTDGDLISRQAVLDGIDTYINKAQSTGTQDDFYSFAELVVKQLPSVKQEPKIGRWIDDKCSVCGKGIEDLIDSREWYENELPNFCPFCGIKIKVEK